jgi:two-component system response regulator AtoC
MDTLLLVDDDISLAEQLKLHFEERWETEGVRGRVLSAHTAARALELAADQDISLVILDMMLPDRSGLELISEFRNKVSEAPIIMVTAHHDMETTIRAMKSGAFDYIHKPFEDLASLDIVVDRALEMRRLSRRAQSMEASLQSSLKLGDIVGNSVPMQRIVKEIGKIASSSASVLIQGESGTGKELIARVIHNYTHDEARPFVGINCSAIVDTLLESELFGHEKGSFTGAASDKLGKFELAEDGTIFLDEIGDMSPNLQAKLLRVLQEREFERVGGVRRLKLRARVIAATHRDLHELVADGRFRADLYQRLKVVTLSLPPLRERREDIPDLVWSLLARINEKVHKQVTRIPPEVLRQMQNMPWYGNVRELENVLTRAVVLSTSDVLLADHLPSPLPASTSSSGADANSNGTSGDRTAELPLTTLAEAEKALITRALRATHGHRGRTCEILGISRPTLERKIRKYRLKTEDPLFQ